MKTKVRFNVTGEIRKFAIKAFLHKSCMSSCKLPVIIIRFQLNISLIDILPKFRKNTFSRSRADKKT